MSILPQPKDHRQLAGKLLDSLLPGSCLLCGADSRNALLCGPCEADLPALPPALCPQCSEQTTHGERCGACLHKPPHFDNTLALYRYDFPAYRLVHALKYGHQLAIADWLGAKLAAVLAGRNFDLIVPLPLHAERLRERGFNQSMEIARALGKRLHLPVERDHVVRCRATPPQAELALKDRHRNVRNAFECHGDLSGKHVLLIDDVMTTGATLSECARVLKLHGAPQVSVAIAARALKH
jgi:ComF family protein